MKKLLPIVLTAVMFAGIPSALAVSPGAAAVPDSVACENIDGRQLVVMTYGMDASDDPALLIKEPFERDGYTYAFESITKTEISRKESKRHSETATAWTASGDTAAVLGALAPTMPYDDGEYAGTLALDHTSIKTEAEGYTTGSYTVSETKTIEGLDRNDPGYVPKSTVKNGRTLMLSDVEWSVQGSALADGALVPSLYTAVATYTGSVSRKTATGYATTAMYTGEVVSEGAGKIAYTVTYSGKPRIAALLGGKPVVAAAATALFAVLAAVFFLLRGNTRIYTPDGAGYELIGRRRVSIGNPCIDLCRLRKYPRGEALIEINGRTARRMFGRIVRVSLRDGIRTHVIEQTGNENYWFTVSTETEKEVSE
ncbi:MAG: hypothetical protein LBS24_08020 [Clostridiales Family XIII bacterium]|jgi:hypothetical protein|nr:hypothetical protein [Clostridiales Family XIII bacterium]